MASAAVFVALGGTSYAVTALPRDSVGSRQIRSGAVGPAELRSGAVRSKEIRDHVIGLRDISLGARRSLRGRPGATGPRGPAGPPLTSFTAAVDAAGSVRSATAEPIGGFNPGTGVYEIVFNRDFRACYAVASLGSAIDAPGSLPDAGEIVVFTTARGVIVRTRNSSGQPTGYPFHVIVLC